MVEKPPQTIRPAVDWHHTKNEPFTTDYNKSKPMDSSSSSYQKKRISVIKGEEESTDQSSQSKEPEDTNRYSEYEPNLNIIRTKRIIDDLDETMKEAHRSKRFKEWNVPIITVHFKTTTAKVLVDTEAQDSALTKELFQELQSNGEDMAV